MDLFIQRFPILNVRVLFAALCFWSFPSLASVSTTVAEWNFALVIGMGLPVLIVSGLLKSKSPFKWRFPALLTVSLLTLLASIIYFTQHQSSILLTSAVLFLSLLYFWSVSRRIEPAINLALISNTLVLIFTAVFIAIVWFFPRVDAYVLWAIVSGVIILLTAIRIKYSSHNSSSFIYRMIVQWLITVVFSVSVFLWLNAEITANWLVLSGVFCYVISIINGCWMLVKTLARGTVNDELDSSEEQKSSGNMPNDVATNLPSQQQAMRNISRIIKSNPSEKYAVIAFKPVNFQQVNKVLGHHNSDILLLQLAYCLQKNVADNKHLLNFNDDNSPIRIARLQGLHFLVVLKLDADENKTLLVEKICQDLTVAVPEAMSFKSFSLNFELTFGIAYMGEHGNSVSQVISYAEDALLAAENDQLSLGYFDNEEVIYTEQHLLKMEQLKQDIVDDKLEWLVQPQTRLRDRKLVGFEVLVHWYNNSDTPLQLHEFIETAEHSGEIYLLTKQMITRAFKLILKLQRVSIYETVSIKLLSQYLLEPDLVSFIEKQIAVYNVPAEYLLIELPENIVLSASERAKITIDELKSLKVNIGIADFSGSYESLRYIRKMAVHQVKINCANIAENTEEISENAIVTALVDLTQKMELPLIGTSIDNKKIEQAFTLLGGELAQGNVIEQGVAIDKIDTWVNTWNGLYNPI
jgi:EAL domain-containing protein (putative c-di-GMP-specific phosphodiesterase class I)/GGDEF domain-containing protein